MKKVCFVIPRAYYLFNPEIKGAEDKVGGAQKQSFLISTTLAEDNNFDVHFCVADFGQKNFEERHQVKLWKAFNFNDHIFKRTRSLFKTLKKINADIYVLRSADVGVAIAILYINRFLKKKILYMLAADAETTHKRLKTHSGIMTSVFMRFAYKKVDIITAQTKQQSKLFENDRKRKPDNIIKNIYTPTNEDPDQIKDNILWVGRLDKIKNPYIYLDLAKKYPGETFIMIAPIVRDFIEYGKQVQKDAKKIPNLQLIDFVKPEKIWNYYLKAKIYVLTSELEGFSNTMAEAMQAECPVLTYNVNPDNILHKFKSGYCADSEINKFYTDFETLNTDLPHRSELGKNGANYIKENHQKDVIIKIFKNILP